MSCVKDLFVVGLSELKIGYFDLRKFQNKIFKQENYYDKKI